MIICHCNCIASEVIERAACGLAAADPWCMLTPVQVYRSIGRRPRCGGCLPLAQQIIHRCVAQQRECREKCPLLQAAPTGPLGEPAPVAAGSSNVREDQGP